jgi:hypothetical protein
MIGKYSWSTADDNINLILTLDPNNLYHLEFSVIDGEDEDNPGDSEDYTEEGKWTKLDSDTIELTPNQKERNYSIPKSRTGKIQNSIIELLFRGKKYQLLSEE